MPPAGYNTTVDQSRSILAWMVRCSQRLQGLTQLLYADEAVLLAKSKEELERTVGCFDDV